MSEKYDGGNAFPSEDNPHGLTIRDYFAAKAMQSFIAVTTEQSTDRDGTRHTEHIDNSQLSYWSYKVADAMLEERKGEQS